MGVIDMVVYTASCDICDTTYGEDLDDWKWSEYRSDAEDLAINHGGWTNHGDVLLCTSTDDAHEAIRNPEEDTDPRPRPGAGQLSIC